MLIIDSTNKMVIVHRLRQEFENKARTTADTIKFEVLCADGWQVSVSADWVDQLDQFVTKIAQHNRAFETLLN